MERRSLLRSKESHFQLQICSLVGTKKTIVLGEMEHVLNSNFCCNRLERKKKTEYLRRSFVCPGKFPVDSRVHFHIKWLNRKFWLSRKCQSPSSHLSGSIPGLGVIYGSSLLSVLVFCSEKFCFGCSSFPKTFHPNPTDPESEGHKLFWLRFKQKGMFLSFLP